MTVIDAAAWTGRDEDKLAFDISRSVRAKQLLEDPMIVHALQTMREAAQKEFFDTRAADKGNRERVWLMGQIINRFEEHFQSLIAEGAMASKKIAALQEARKNPLKRFIG